jgi:hypothetical protein
MRLVSSRPQRPGSRLRVYIFAGTKTPVPRPRHALVPARQGHSPWAWIADLSLTFRMPDPCAKAETTVRDRDPAGLV